MIEIICDACDKPFEVDSAEAGGKVECPMCGDVNKVPLPRAESRSGSASPARDDGPERELQIVRPGMFRARPFRYLLMVLAMLGGASLGIAGLATEKVPTWGGSIGFVLALVAGGWFGIWWLTTHWWIKLVITNKRTIRHEGIVTRHTTEVLHDHVRSVDIEQSFIQRLLGIGKIGISSAAQSDTEIQMTDIPDPYEVKALIDEYRDL
ncbi:MAG: PH domain-containing protein [Planctomycetota bacterium]